MQPRTPLFVSLLPAGCQLRPYYIAESDINDDDNQEEVSVDSGDDQPSADVESQDLCEVRLLDSTRLCHAATGALAVSA